MMRNKEQTLGNLMDHQKIAYLSYLDSEGYPVTKAMLMTKDRFWEEGDERYYPLGVTDPDYCILKFTAEKGRYFSNGSEDFSIE